MPRFCLIKRHLIVPHAITTDVHTMQVQQKKSIGAIGESSVLSDVKTLALKEFSAQLISKASRLLSNDIRLYFLNTLFLKLPRAPGGPGCEPASHYAPSLFQPRSAVLCRLAFGRMWGLHVFGTTKSLLLTETTENC